MEIAKGKIGNALTSTADNHVVVVANDIYDEDLGKYQSEINAQGNTIKDIVTGMTNANGNILALDMFMLPADGVSLPSLVKDYNLSVVRKAASRNPAGFDYFPVIAKYYKAGSSEESAGLAYIGDAGNGQFTIKLIHTDKLSYTLWSIESDGNINNNSKTVIDLTPDNDSGLLTIYVPFPEISLSSEEVENNRVAISKIIELMKGSEYSSEDTVYGTYPIAVCPIESYSKTFGYIDISPINSTSDGSVMVYTVDFNDGIVYKWKGDRDGSFPRGDTYYENLIQSISDSELDNILI